MDDLKYPEHDPNKKSPAQLWKERYVAAGDKYLFGKEPSLLLKSHVGELRKGRAIDIAMGEGKNVVFLAQNGFQAEGIDAVPEAVEKAKKLAAEKNVTIDVKSQNLDFFLMPLMKYDSIVMTYFRPLPRFFSEIRRGLVQGGTFLLEAYLVDHIRHQAVPNPLIDFEECYKPNEVLGHLKEFQILYYSELAQGNAHLVQCIARKNRV
jgi:tellurite methyltransferase